MYQSRYAAEPVAVETVALHKYSPVIIGESQAQQVLSDALALQSGATELDAKQQRDEGHRRRAATWRRMVATLLLVALGALVVLFMHPA